LILNEKLFLVRLGQEGLELTAFFKAEKLYTTFLIIAIGKFLLLTIFSVRSRAAPLNRHRRFLWHTCGVPQAEFHSAVEPQPTS
jgi:hypothetical protein